MPAYFGSPAKSKHDFFSDLHPTGVYVYFFAADCRTLTYRKKWEQHIAGLCWTPAEQPAGHSSIVENGRRTLQDTCRTTCRTLASCKKWEQDVAGLCWTPEEQPARHSCIVKNGNRTLQDTCRTSCRTLTYCKKWEQDIAGLCRTPAEQLAGRSSIAKKWERGTAGHLQDNLQDAHLS